MDLLRAMIIKKKKIDKRYNEIALKHFSMNCKNIISVCRKRIRIVKHMKAICILSLMYTLVTQKTLVEEIQPIRNREF
jgi:hypothetical protein